PGRLRIDLELSRCSRRLPLRELPRGTGDAGGSELRPRVRGGDWATMSDMTAVMHRRTSHVARLLGLLVVAIGLILGPATPARAHAVLVSSSPVPDVVLSNAPTEVVLTFSESVRQVPGKIRVLSPN